MNNSIRTLSLIAIMVFCLVPSVVFAQAEENEGIEISGFSDFLFAATDQADGEADFALGQTEIDLETTVDNNIDVAVAVCYDNAGGAFGLGAAIVDFHVLGSGENNFNHSDSIESAGVIAGQFDVPFGLDWQVYPSVDRRLISGPLVVENTHDFWNDYGVQGYAETDQVSVVAYATNGFGHEGQDKAGADFMAQVERAIGGRLGFRPVGSVEVGSSYANMMSNNSDQAISLIGLDLQWNHGSLSLKGEYVSHNLAPTKGNEVINDGFYGQGTYDLDSAYLVARYDRFSSEEANVEALERVSAGVGRTLTDNAELRMEYQVGVSDNLDDTAVMQLAIRF